MSARKIGFNAAGRLFNLLTAAAGSRSKSAMLEDWLNVFEIEDRHGDVRDEHLIASLLRAVGHEMDAVVVALQDREIPDTLISPYMNQLRNVQGLALLNQPANLTVQYLTPVVLLSLQWYSIVLPDEETEETSETLAQLRLQIAGLEEALQNKGLPIAFRIYAENLVDGLKAALRLVPVQGLGPMKAAVEQAVARAHFNEDKLKAELDKHGHEPMVEKLRLNLSATLKTAADSVGYLEKISKGYGYLLGKASDLGTVIADSLSR